MAETITPKSVSHWREMKNKIVEEDAVELADTLGLLDLILVKFSEVHTECQPVPSGNKLTWVCFILDGSHRMLLNAADLLVQRQRVEAFGIIRATIELAVAAAKIGRKPELATVWLNRKHDDKDDFHSKWTKGDKLTEPLKVAWKLASNNGSHGNVNAFILNLDTREKGMVKSYYVMQDIEELRRSLIYLVEIIARILQVFVVSLKPLAKSDLEGKVAILMTAIEMHKLNYKWLFEKAQAEARARIATRAQTKTAVP